MRTLISRTTATMSAERVTCEIFGKIDEILRWEKTRERREDARFVELGEYFCEVRSKQY
jgi:hypothetical protein